MKDKKEAEKEVEDALDNTLIEGSQSSDAKVNGTRRRLERQPHSTDAPLPSETSMLEKVRKEIDKDMALKGDVELADWYDNITEFTFLETLSLLEQEIGKIIDDSVRWVAEVDDYVLHAKLFKSRLSALFETLRGEKR